MTRVAVCQLADLVEAEPVRFEPGGPEGRQSPPILVVLAEDGEVYSIDDTCTHQEASLSDGWVEGCEIECPLHASRFSLKTGQVDALPATKPVRTHAVTIEAGTVYVELSEERPNLPPGVSF